MADDAAGGSGTATAAVGVGGDILSTALGMANQQWATAGTKQMQKRSIAANAQSQLAAYNYARSLRQTAYQDTMSDMRAAGLNPMLAFSQGASGAAPVSAAGAPSGSAAQAGPSAISGSSINSAMNAGLIRDQMRANIQQTLDAAFNQRAQGNQAETQARLAPLIATGQIAAFMGSAASGHSAAGLYRTQAENQQGAGAGPSWWQAIRQWLGGDGGMAPPNSGRDADRRPPAPPHRDPRPLPGNEPGLGAAPHFPSHSEYDRSWFNIEGRRPRR